MQKVNFNAKHEYEFVKNFKVLQTVFDKLGLDKVGFCCFFSQAQACAQHTSRTLTRPTILAPHTPRGISECIHTFPLPRAFSAQIYVTHKQHIDVAKLAKGKYQDNLEFLQWIKRYYDLHAPQTEYNAVERRKQAGVAAAKPVASGTGVSSPAAATTVKKVPAAAAPSTTTAIKKPIAAPAAATKVAATTTKPAASKSTTATAATAKPKPAATTGGSASASAGAGGEEQNQKIVELQQSVAELKLTIDGLEKERDFYFGKLREIEILCQNSDQESDIVKGFLKIL